MVFGSSFQFLQLPKFIRESIYDYHIQPFRNKHQNNRITMEIEIIHNVYKGRCHPFRNGYELKIPVAVKDHAGPFDCKYRHLKREHYEIIRSLSSVSHQVRAELGAAFWKNIYLDIEDCEYLLFDCINDRPAIVESIKVLSMEWGCDKSPDELDYVMIDFCKLVATKLKLDKLVFCLRASPYIARQIIASGARIAWVKAFRAIETKILRVKLRLHDEDEVERSARDDSSKDDSERYERLAREMAPLMEEVLRDPVPRVVELTDQEAYLQERAT